MLQGTNFISSNGWIVVQFGGQNAVTSCPVQTTCTATVPIHSGSPSRVPVTVTTQSGTSNALTFDYD